MKSQKFKIYNTFHGTEAIVLVKSEYCVDDGDGHSPDTWLQCEAYCRGDDAAYCRRKLREIKRKLCPHGDSCKCGGAQRWIRI